MCTFFLFLYQDCPGSQSIAPIKKSAANRDSGRIKVIIDTDIGEDIDDLLVTAFALNSPEFEVLAITVVDGDVQARSRISRPGGDGVVGRRRVGGLQRFVADLVVDLE